MSDKLCDFIKKVNEDEAVRDKFNADKVGTMTDFGVSADDQQLILDGNMEELEKRCGDELCEVNSNPFILTYHSPH